MDSELGWTHISRAAVQRAEAQLTSDTQGILDEIGMLELHQGYADRFFPGTSVLHTRLRYVLFVAWTYEDLRRRRTVTTNIGRAVALQETELGKALQRNTHSWGLIGRRILPRMPAQRPSSTYWNALSTWGLLHKHLDGSVPSRAEVDQRLANHASATQLRDDENRALDSDESAFIPLPPIPPGWPHSQHLNFKLTEREQVFLRDLLSRVCQPRSSRPSLLGRLAMSGAGRTLAWDSPLLCPEVLAVAEDDLPVLQRADQAASLSAIARNVYSALLEQMCIEEGLGERTRALENLNVAIESHRDNALRLDVDLLAADIAPRLSKGVRSVLELTQTWLGSTTFVSDRHTLQPLLNLYTGEERRRKQGRARLSPMSKTRRREWWQNKARATEQPDGPLHFRWNVAIGLLRDLENEE